MDEPDEIASLTRLQVFLLAAACGVTVANAYYIHPIISMIADAFSIGEGMIGIVPALNQFGLALGILLLLPLGDMISNRALTLISVVVQTICVFGMAFAPGFELFLAASSILGFFTIAPYLLPAFASKRVPKAELGYVTAVLTTGIIIGILIARGAAGIIAEQFGWRTVYVVAGLVMVVVTLALPLIMEKGGGQAGGLSMKRYGGLLASLWPLLRKYPEILISGSIQALGFGTFIAIWMGLGLHLPSEEMGYGVDIVGYLALLAVFSMVTTPQLGRWADGFGARRARIVIALLQAAAMLIFVFVGHSLWLLLIPLIITNMFGPTIDVTGRMTFLSLAPEIRTRLMTVYIVLMFIGGGLGSWIGTASFAWGGWIATALVTFAMMLVALALSVLDYQLEKSRGEAA